jgi:hypothetical protein
MKRSEVVGRLNEFRRDIDKCIYALPSAMLGIQFNEVISASVELTKQIDLLRGALIEAMLREGLSVHSENDCPPLSSWNYYAAGLSHEQRSQFPTSNIQGCNDLSVERYPNLMSTADRSRPVSHARFPKIALNRSLSAHGSPTINQAIQYNTSQCYKIATPVRPPRSVDSLDMSQELSPSLLQRPDRQSTPNPQLHNQREIDKLMQEFEQRMSEIESEPVSFQNLQMTEELP